MPELTDAQVFGGRELSDAEVFGAAPVKELSDAEVFGQAPAAIAPTPDTEGISDEVSGFVRSLERGGRRFVQQGDIIGLRRVGELEDQLKEAEGVLAKHDADFNGKPDPTGRLSKFRNDQLGRIGTLKNELRRYQEMAPELAASFGKQQAAIEKIPLTEAQANFQKADTSWTEFFKNPIELSANALAESLPSMVTGLVGAPLGPVGMAATTGASSASATSASRVTRAMQEAKVDLNDPKQVLAWFANRAQSQPEIARADLAALGPGVFDALTAGFAGRILGPLLGKGVAKVTGGVAGEAGMQAAGGAAGSAAESLLAGEAIDPKDVLLEAMVEMFGAPAEVVSNVRGEVKRGSRLPKPTADATRLSPRTTTDAATGQKMNVVGGEPLPEVIAPEPTVTTDPKTDTVDTANALKIPAGNVEVEDLIRGDSYKADQIDSVVSALEKKLKLEFIKTGAAPSNVDFDQLLRAIRNQPLYGESKPYQINKPDYVTALSSAVDVLNGRITSPDTWLTDGAFNAVASLQKKLLSRAESTPVPAATTADVLGKPAKAKAAAAVKLPTAEEAAVLEEMEAELGPKDRKRLAAFRQAELEKEQATPVEVVPEFSTTAPVEVPVYLTKGPVRGDVLASVRVSQEPSGKFTIEFFRIRNPETGAYDNVRPPNKSKEFDTSQEAEQAGLDFIRQTLTEKKPEVAALPAPTTSPISRENAATKTVAELQEALDSLRAEIALLAPPTEGATPEQRMAYLTRKTEMSNRAGFLKEALDIKAKEVIPNGKEEGQKEGVLKFKVGDRVAMEGSFGINRGVVIDAGDGKLGVRWDKYPDNIVPLDQSNTVIKPDSEVPEPKVDRAKPFTREELDTLTDNAKHISDALRTRALDMINKLRAAMAARGINPDTAEANSAPESSAVQRITGSLTRVGRQQKSIDLKYKRADVAKRDGALKQLTEVFTEAEALLTKKPSKTKESGSKAAVAPSAPAGAAAAVPSKPTKPKNAQQVADYIKEKTGEDVFVYRDEGGRGNGVGYMQIVGRADTSRSMTLGGEFKKLSLDEHLNQWLKKYPKKEAATTDSRQVIDGGINIHHGQIPDDPKQAGEWVGRLVKDATGLPTDNKTATRKTVVVRDNDTGKLLEIGIYDVGNPLLVNPKKNIGGKRAANGINPLKFFNTKSKTAFEEGGILHRYELLGTILYSDARTGVHREITKEEFDALTSDARKLAAAPPEVTTTTAKEGSAEEGTTRTVITESPAEPAPISELESWLRAKLQDKKTGKLKPITPDGALDLTDEFALGEPESYREVVIEIATPLAKTDTFKALSRKAQAEQLRQLFASRIYELVARNYRRQEGITEDNQLGAGPTAAGEAPAIEVESTVTQPAGTAEQSTADKIVAKLESLKTDPTKLYALPDLGITATLWNGALTTAQVAIRAGEAIGSAINKAIEWIKIQKADADEAKIRTALESALADYKPAVETPEGDPQPEVPNEEWESMPTNVSGVTFRVRSRDRLTPESFEVSRKVAEDAFNEAGLKATLVSFEDTDGITKSAYRIAPEATPEEANRKGRALLAILNRELANQRTQGKAADHVAMLIGSIREAPSDPNSAVSQMEEGLRLRLFATAQEEASWRGRALRALRNIKTGLIEVGENFDVSLLKIYSDAFGGDAVRSVFDRVRAGIRAAMTDEEINKLADTISDPALRAPFVASLRKALAGEFSNTENVVSDTSAGVRATPGVTVSEEALADVDRALSERMREAASQAGRGITKQQLTDKEREALSGKKFKTVLDLIESGVLDDAEALRAFAKKRGLRVPTKAEVATIKKAAQAARQITAPTEAELAKAGGDPMARRALEVDLTGVLYERREKLLKQVATAWSTFTRPVNLLRWNSETKTHNARFLNELLSANLLMHPSFASKQAMDILTQWAWRIPIQGLANGLTLYRQDIENGNPANLWRDLESGLKREFSDNIKNFSEALTKAQSALRGKIEVKNVDRIMGGIAAMDRIWAKADAEAAQGNYLPALLLRIIGSVGYAYRFAGAMDYVHGLPAERARIRQRIIQRLRDDGALPAEAELRAQWIMDDVKVNMIEAVAMARSILEARGYEYTDADLREDTLKMLEKRMYERINQSGLPADAIQENAELYRNTLGWNERETRGVGGLVGNLIHGVGRLLEQKGIPTPMGRFSNAIAIGINRMLQRTAFYALTDVHVLGGTRDVSSPWFRTQEDLNARRLEAAAGTLVGGLLLGLAWSGLARVWLKPPQDKEEKELWEREGHKAGTVEFQTGDGKTMVVPLAVGPLALFSPYLAAGGALYDLTLKQEKKQQKLNEEAARLGIAPGKVADPSFNDWFGVAVQSAQSMVLGNRTASGLFYSATDFGTPNLKKFTASQIGPFVPYLPAYQEVARMSGVTIDPKKANLWDLLVPLESSGARKVNSLGDPVGTPDDVQRVLQTMALPAVVNKSGTSSTPYAVLQNTGFRPPTINPDQGYAIGGDYRPMNGEEMAKYTQLRGEYLKQALSQLSPDADVATVRAAYEEANTRALEAVGVTPTRRVRTTTTTVSAGPRISRPLTARPVSTAGALAPRPSGSRLGGLRRSRLSRPRTTVRTRTRTTRFRKPKQVRRTRRVRF